MLKQKFNIALSIAMLSMLSACATNAPVLGSSQVNYGDTGAVETINTDFGSTDLNMLSQEMTTGLINSNKLNKCKFYTVSPIRNKTAQYIDTENITQAIVDKLSNSSLVQSQYVLSEQEMANQKQELDQQNSEYYNHNKTAKKGNMQGAQCRIDGFISSIEKQNNNIKDVFYVFNIKLISIEDGIVLWQNSKQVRKTMKK